MNYDLNRFNPNVFEELIQSLLKKIIGQGTTTFGQGPDGGREATYEGSAPYPSETNRWIGKWIFQAKFHNTYENTAYARKEVLKELEVELKKITRNFQKRCDNYIMATNVSLSSVKDSGTLDKIDQVRTKFKDEISNIHVWGYQEISRYLDQYEDIRRTYAHLATPGDAISSLMQGREDEGRRKHQNDDIKKIFECWVNIDIYAVRYLYGSSYPPCFEDFYTEILNQIQRCDPYNEGLLHLKTGYHESAFKKYESLKNKVIKHNKMVATYVISSGRDIRKCITQTIRSLQVCGDNEALILNSYYISNVIVHLRNVASDGKVTLNIKSECVNGVDGFTLYSNGGIRLAFGSQPRISRLNTFLEEYSECFTKEYKKILLSLNGITPLLDDFRVDIHSLIPKAKYGHLNGKCEFEEIDSN